MLSALGRIFIEAAFARYRTWAKRQGFGDAPTGAVTRVQRFGSSVNLNVHFHSMVLDGVFTRGDVGQIVGQMNAVAPVSVIVERLVQELRQAAGRVSEYR